MTSSLGIVIPTLNEEKRVRRLLRSLVASGVDPCDIWVVDGGSTDRTGIVATEVGARLFYYGRGIRRGPTASGPSGIAAGRNLGFEKTEASHVLFLDADMEVTPELVSEVRNLISKGAEAVTIPEVTTGDTILARVRRWERQAELVDDINQAPRVFAVKMLHNAGGYRSDMDGFEDLELKARLVQLGVPIHVTKNCVYHHEGDLSLGDYLRKRHRYSRGAVQLRDFHPEFAVDLYSWRRRLRVLARGLKARPNVFLFVGALILKGAEGLLIVSRISVSSR